jgi:GA module protein
MKKLLALPALALVGMIVGSGAASADPQTWKEKRQERRAARAATPDADEWRQAWQALSAEDQATLTQAWAAFADYAHNLTPAQKERIRAAAQQTADRLRRLTPAQKAQLREQLEKAREAYQGMSADDKAALLSKIADTIERLQSLTPAQKESLKAMYRRLLGL